MKKIFCKTLSVLKKGTVAMLCMVLVPLMVLLAAIGCVKPDDELPQGVADTPRDDSKRVLWVVPIDASAFPINNTITGNADLNSLFEEYHVESYRFLDSIFLESTWEKEAIYEIRLKSEYAHLENDLGFKLRRSPFMSNSNGLFKEACQPFFNRDYGVLLLTFVTDPSLNASSPTRSSNEQLNAVLSNYNVLSYTSSNTFFGDTSIIDITITCDYSDVVGLYNALLPLNHFFEHILVGCTYDKLEGNSGYNIIK
ncbi:MAG: hypothetical protein FWH36_08400 [Lentimicrobiaceae bacterium]|nr:hypothetical protein [Lentimicrobiaceae bacterium]